ncbi:MAG: EAL domain-containing protein [Hyphomicrobiaceae bacterium]|nr:MAG: EAL domain-containing protein [Hyphomicrobiaceae bacterium]
MAIWDRLKRPHQGQPLPTEIYISLVDSLFSDFRTLFVGSMAASVTALITAWRTGEVLLYLCSFAIAVVACVRWLDVRAFYRRRHDLTTSEEARKWEMRYVVGAAAHVALLGTWCLIAFAKTSDPFVQIFSFSLTLAYMIGISGRNFASNPLVTAQIICAGVPMTAALLTVGGAYYAIFAFVLVPFFATLKFISDRLRKVLLDAVIASRDVSLLAGRFDTALNNMPHGLCMFDVHRRVVVANRRLAELLYVSSDIPKKRATARDLVLECVRGGTLSTAGAEHLAKEFDERLSRHVDGELVVEIETGRTLDLTFHPTPDGGSVVLFEDITDRKVAEAKIHQLARYDSLTGLPNRAYFREQMDTAVGAVRRRGPFAIHFVDLDEFKQVNDTLGHPCGDELLCAVADRLRRVVRGSDIVARFGGDEFVVLQYPLFHPKEAASLAERIVASLSEAFQISGHQIVVGASVGIAIAPRDGADADLLLKNADMALYHAKSDGKAGWRFFEYGMDVSAQARRTLQLDLRSALANGGFEVYYQPLLNMHTKRISTCEALLRWPHPERGFVSPVEFIPVAEEMGLIVEIGNFVLRQACVECAKWPKDVRVAVNLSPIQFRRGDVAKVIQEALAASGLPANRLEIEITESVFLQDTDATRIWLDQLREMGVRISLDDFGTGYSSLSYLANFPLNKVKIDRSFLHGLGKSSRPLTLLYGVARLSADLNMSVAVEGVETEEQLALIAREKSVEEIQGFLIGRAVPAAEIRERLYAPVSHLLDKVA